MSRVKLIHYHDLPDIQDIQGNWIRTYAVEANTCYHTMADKPWKSLLFRCKPERSGSINNFRDFNEFTEWSNDEYGYFNRDSNGQRWQLDKDLKFYGNKVYNTENCLYVPARVNTLFTSCLATRGEFPVGVCFNKKMDKFTAYCENGEGKQKHLGVFTCPLEAHRARQQFKIQVVERILREDLEVMAHKDLVKALSVNVERIKSDLNSNIITV